MTSVLHRMQDIFEPNQILFYILYSNLVIVEIRTF